MDIGFRRQSDAALFNDPERLRRKFGAPCAEVIQARLAQVQAANTLEILCRLPQARCHQPDPDHNELFSIDLDHPLRLIAEVSDSPVPRLGDGQIDRGRVHRLRINEITNLR